MKKTILFIAFLLMGVLTNAQTHFNYKGLLTENNTPLANSIITVKVTIEAHHSIPSPGTTTIWQEEHSGVHTDANGIFSIEIGAGTKIGGTATNFYDIDWRPFLNNIRYDIDIDTGSGYQNFVSDEYFKSVPYSNYSHEAGKLKPGYHSVEVLNNASTYNGFIVNGKGDIERGLRLRDGSDDWYTYMDSNKNFVIRNDGTDVFKISDTDNSVWIKGELHADDSGDADMKAYIYGYFLSNGTIKTNASTSGFTVTKMSTGEYKVTFTHSPGASDRYIVVATAQGSDKNVGIAKSSNYFRIWVRNTDTNNYQDAPVQFVVFKK